MRNPSDDRNRLVEVDAEIEREAPEAWLLDVGLDKPVWVPKSQVEDLGENTFKMPEWLALRKGII